MKQANPEASKWGHAEYASRVLCVWLPDFPIQRLHCEFPRKKSAATVLYAESGSRANVVIASPEARRYGIRAGMSLAEAQALHESADFLPHDTDADTKALLTLADICYRYSPLVGLELANDAHCLLLDISGCAHLHGDESGLARHLVIALAECDYFAHVAVAGTIGAAWAIARFGHGTGTDRRLRSLPVEALRISNKLISRLREFDLRAVGQLTALPRASLPSRFGAVLTERLDQLYGRCDELLTPVPRPEPVVAQWIAEEPTRHRGAIQHVCTDLLAEILDILKSRGEGLLGLELSLICEAAAPFILNIRLAQPNDSLPHLLKLLELKLETQAVPEWLHTIRIEASETSILQTRQRDLFALQESTRHDHHVRRLTDRLLARLGPDAVVRPQRLPEAIPEQAVKHAPLSGAVPDGSSPVDSVQPSARPLVLLAKPEPVRITRSALDGPPEQFYWNQHCYSVACCTEVERIATGWWQTTGSIHRDYYRVETRSGARFWLFRDRNNNWFLHGLFE